MRSWSRAALNHVHAKNEALAARGTGHGPHCSYDCQCRFQIHSKRIPDALVSRIVRLQPDDDLHTFVQGAHKVGVFRLQTSTQPYLHEPGFEVSNFTLS